MDHYTQQLTKRLAEILFELDHTLNRTGLNVLQRVKSFVHSRHFRQSELVALAKLDWDEYSSSKVHRVRNNKNNTKQHKPKALGEFRDAVGLNETHEWNFINSLFLAITTYTTIGVKRALF